MKYSPSKLWQAVREEIMCIPLRVAVSYHNTKRELTKPQYLPHFAIETTVAVGAGLPWLVLANNSDRPVALAAATVAVLTANTPALVRVAVPVYADLGRLIWRTFQPAGPR